ncbi:MAG: hypothetical protein Q7R63_00735 [bacterium]|nr:hypothetical protein [bacterium]
MQGKIAAMQRDLKTLREAVKNSSLPQEEKEAFYKSLNTLDKHTLERAKGNYNALIALKNAHDPDAFNRFFAQTESYYKKLLAERDRLEELSDIAQAAGQRAPTKLIEQNHEELERVERKYKAFQKIKRDGARAINPLLQEALAYEEGFKTELGRFRGSFRLMLERLGSSLPDPHFPPLKKQNKFGDSSSLQDINKKNLFLPDCDGLFPDDETVAARAMAGKSAPVSPQNNFPARDVIAMNQARQGVKDPQPTPRTRADFDKALKAWEKEVNENNLKMKALRQAPGAKSVARGLLKGVLQIMPFLPLPSEVINSLTGTTNQDYIDYFQERIKEGEGWIANINVRIVELENKIRGITPVAARPQSGNSMKGDDSRARQAQLKSLQDQVDALYDARNQWKEAIMLWKASMEEKIMDRAIEESTKDMDNSIQGRNLRVI